MGKAYSNFRGIRETETHLSAWIPKFDPRGYRNGSQWSLSGHSCSQGPRPDRPNPLILLVEPRGVEPRTLVGVGCTEGSRPGQRRAKVADGVWMRCAAETFSGGTARPLRARRYHLAQSDSPISLRRRMANTPGSPRVPKRDLCYGAAHLRGCSRHVALSRQGSPTPFIRCAAAARAKGATVQSAGAHRRSLRLSDGILPDGNGRLLSQAIAWRHEPGLCLGPSLSLAAAAPSTKSWRRPHRICLPQKRAARRWGSSGDS